MAKIAKRVAKANEAFVGKMMISVEEAVKLIKGAASAKFDETLEIAMNLGVDPRHADQMVRGVVQLPNGTGKAGRSAGHWNFSTRPRQRGLPAAPPFMARFLIRAPARFSEVKLPERSCV